MLGQWSTLNTKDKKVGKEASLLGHLIGLSRANKFIESHRIDILALLHGCDLRSKPFKKGS